MLSSPPNELKSFESAIEFNHDNSVSFIYIDGCTLGGNWNLIGSTLTLNFPYDPFQTKALLDTPTVTDFSVKGNTMNLNFTNTTTRDLTGNGSEETLIINTTLILNKV